MTRTTANILLLTAAAIWGSAFVAQSVAMQVIHPLWYSGIRFLIAAAAVAPFAFREWRQSSGPIARDGWWLIAIITVIMAISANVQQFAMQTATASNAGFLTSLYVLFTPIVGFLLYRHRPRPIVWLGALIGLSGTWLLGGGLAGGMPLSFGRGDGLIVVSAVGWAVLLVLIGRSVQTVGRPIGLTFAQNIVTGVACCLIAIPLAPISMAIVEAALWPILYGGLVSGGIAYTFQAIGQRHTRATDAAMLLSAEAPFAALAGAAILGERLSPTGWAGCAVIFGAILLVQLWPDGRRAGAAAA